MDKVKVRIVFTVAFEATIEVDRNLLDDPGGAEDAGYKFCEEVDVPEGGRDHCSYLLDTTELKKVEEVSSGKVLYQVPF